MYPTLFTIGKYAIPSYTVLLDLGLILGLVLAYYEGKRALRSGELALDVGLWAIVGGIIGGRLGFVIANWSVFREAPIRAIRLWEGGLSFHGAFLGGLIVLGLAAYLESRSRAADSRGRWRFVLKMADLLVPSLAIGLAFGWAGCLLYGSAFGVVGEGFGYAILPDVTGLEAPRFATQAFGLAESLILLVLAWLLRKRWPFRGAGFFMFNLLYFAGQFFLENTRGDETLYVGTWRLPQIIDAALVLLFAVGLLVLWWRARNALEPEEPLAEEAAAEGDEEAEESSEAPVEEAGVGESAPESEAEAEQTEESDS